jgi:uncharacterized protein YhbP (UPF0306 family)
MIVKTVTEINSEILDFISANKVATVCGCSDNVPHCFSCFYAILEEDGCLVFKSSGTTRHMQIFSENNMVAGTIVAAEISKTKIEGVQFEGMVAEKDELNFKATKAYYLRFPFAVTVPGRIWVIRLNNIKYTNTTNGIKRKAEWTRNA